MVTNAAEAMIAVDLTPNASIALQDLELSVNLEVQDRPILLLFYEVLIGTALIFSRRAGFFDSKPVVRASRLPVHLSEVEICLSDLELWARKLNFC